MKRIKYFILFFLMFHWPSMSSADSSLVRMERVLHLEKLQGILDFGIKQVGNVDLKELVKQAGNLIVYWNDGKPITEESTERRSARYSSGTVIINQKVIDGQIKRQRVENDLVMTLYFHEYLGALGYNDVDYQLSSVLTLTYMSVELAKVRAHYLTRLRVWEQYLGHLKFELPHYSIVEGGSSTTGGGGEHAPALFKFALLSHLIIDSDNLHVFKKEELEVIRFLLNMRIEMDWKKTWTQNGLAFMDVRDGRGILWLPENFSLESINHALSLNSPEFILENLIRPEVKKLERGVSLSCQKFYGK